MLVRHSAPGGVTFLVPPRMEEAGFLVAFTERTGGISEGSFASLNLGLKAGDDIRNARTNRRRLCSAMGVDAFAVGRQVHGARIARVGARRTGSGFDDPTTAFPGTDALTTSLPGVAMAVLTADCVPVALADPRSGRLAVVHAGWRGVAAGVLRRAVGIFDRPGAVLAAIGPAVGLDHYEVGDDVVEAVGSATERGPVVQRRRPRFHLDLPATVELILREVGVTSIEHDPTCTACRPERFFSHRRDGRTGRQGVIAVRLS